MKMKNAMITTNRQRLTVVFALLIGLFGWLAVQAARADEPRLALMDPISVLDFGRQNVETAGVARSLTFTNAGSTALMINSVRLTGVNPSDFNIVSDACTGAALNMENTCTVTITFVSAGIGSRSARLSFETSSSPAPIEMPISGFGQDPRLPMRVVGPIDLAYGFPVWYTDEAGLRLTLCLDQSGLCLGKLPDPGSPAAVSDAQDNFPGEAFWWYAEAKISRPNGGKVLLVLSKEATFLNGRPVVGDQIAFDRLRIRIDKLVAGQTYRVTHPFGVANLRADSKGEIYVTEDTGCLNTPCDFQRSMTSIFKTFLRWDPNIAPLAPGGYIGDPNRPHTVVGSPYGTNFFKVEGPNAGGTNINVVQTSLFNVQGQIY